MSRLSFLILPPLISFIFSFLFAYSSMQYKLFVNCEENALTKLYMLCYMLTITIGFPVLEKVNYLCRHLLRANIL